MRSSTKRVDPISTQAYRPLRSNNHICGAARDGCRVIVSTPAVGADNLVQSVACADSSYCWAVGYEQPQTGVYDTLTEEYSGDGWIVGTSPNPSGATQSYLTGVTCVSGSCPTQR